MNAELFNALDELEKTKGISKDYMIEKIRAGLVSAFKRENGGNENVNVVIDPEKKDIKVIKLMEVVETVENPYTQISLEEAKTHSKRAKIGSTIKIDQKTKEYGRISAQTAKQVIIQGIREAERNIVVKSYTSKKEELMSAVVVKVDPVTGDAVVETETSRAVLKKDEQIPGEYLEPGDHIKVYVTEVTSEVKGPIVTLSRTHPGLVKRLFELEVPEIQEGLIVIRSVSREAGSRTKIAVESRDENVDPVGSCIGNRGARIANVVDELCGEKIDVIKYSDQPEEYIAAALAPANVVSVTMESDRSSRVIVSPDQLSLAIGKEGQNVRLAARLTGIKIDIKTN